MTSEIDNNKRVAKLRVASEQIKDIYVSDLLVEKTDLLIEKFAITQPYKTVADIIGDTILGFNRIAEMPELFVEQLGVSMQTAQKMTSDLVEFLGPVLMREEELAESKKSDLQKLADAFAEKSKLAQKTSTLPVQGSPTDKASATPVVHTAAELEKVQPMRTMKDDINRVHGYGAHYEEMEKEAMAHSSQQGSVLDSKNT